MSQTPSSNRIANARIARARFDWRQYVVYGGFLLVFLVFSISLYGSGFLTLNNLLNIVRQTSTITVMAVAMTFVIAAGEIDLSVGSLAGLSSVTTAMAVSQFGIIPGIIAGILTGLLVGFVNGILVTKVLIPSFLVTLGMLGIGNGIAMWMTDTAPVPIANKVYNNVFGSGNGPVPSLLIWTVVTLVIGHIALRKTPYGRQVLATGGNRLPHRSAVSRRKEFKFLALMISGLAAALGGMLYAGRLHSGRFQWGQGDELSVIAAVILGGTSLSGGIGSVIGAVIGSLLIGLIDNGLLLMGLAYSQQLIIRGAIIILAVALGRRGKSI